MVTLSDIWEKFMPIYQFFAGLWDWLNQGVWANWLNASNNIPLVNLFIKPIIDFIANNTGIDEWLNQFSMLTFTTGAGLTLVLVVTIIGWVGDKFGL